MKYTLLTVSLWAWAFLLHSELAEAATKPPEAETSTEAKGEITGAAQTAATAESAAGLKVGDLGLVKNIHLEGNRAIKAEAIQRGLQANVEYLLAAHPLAPREEFLAKLPVLIRAGYHHAGFPDATVALLPANGPAPQEVRVQVTEGQGYVKGAVKIYGATIIPAEEIIAALTTQPPQIGMAARVISLMWEIQKPKAEAKAKAATAKLQEKVPHAQLKFDSAGDTPESTKEVTAAVSSFLQNPTPSVEIPWVEGTPASFGVSAETALAAKVKEILAERGYPQYQVASHIKRGKSGRAEAMVELEEAGLQGIIGNIDVVGNHKDTAQEFAQYLELRPGAAYKASMFQKSMVALWNSGRFLDFWITITQRQNGNPEMDFSIEVTELPDAPSLSDQPTPKQNAMINMIRWLDKTFAEGERELLLTATTETGVSEFALACDGRSAGVWQHGADHLAFKLDDAGFTTTGSLDTTAIQATAPVSLANLKLFVSLAVVRETDGTFSPNISFGGGYATGPSSSNRVGVEIHPALAFLPRWDEMLSLQNGMMIWEKGGSKITADAATGEIEEGGVDLAEAGDLSRLGKLSWRLEAGGLRRLLQRMEATQAAPAAAPPQSSGIAPQLIGLALELWFSGKEDAAKERARSVLTELLASGMGELLGEWFHSTTTASPAAAQFEIPMEQLPPGISAAAFLVASYANLLVELFPANSWGSKLGRELFYILAGDTRFTEHALNEIYRDPTLGPLGSWFIAQLLEQMRPEYSSRFLQRALQQDGLADFQKDVRSMLADEGILAKALTSMVASLKRMNPAQLELLLSLAPPAQRSPLETLFTALHQPQPTSLVELVEPSMNQLWVHHWQPALHQKLTRRWQESKYQDQMQTAAVVNGEPVSRVFVKYLQQHEEILKLLPPRPAAALGQGEEPGVAAAIDMELVHQLFVKQGGTVNQNVFRQDLWKLTNLTAEASERDITEALNAQQMSTSMALRVYELIEVYATMSRGTIKALPAPTEKEVKAYMADPLPPLDDGTRHIHLIRIPKGDHPEAQRQLADRLHDTATGAEGFDTVWSKKAQGLDDTSPTSNCYSKLARKTFNEPLDSVAFGLELGKVSKVVETPDFFCLLYAVPPDKHRFSKGGIEEHSKAVAELTQRRAALTLRQNLDRLRAGSMVAITPHDAALQVTPPPAQQSRRIEAEQGDFTIGQQHPSAVQDMTDWGPQRWSGNAQAFFKVSKGETVIWLLEVDQAGLYDLTLQATRAPDYGTVALELDGIPIGAALDFYAPSVQPSGGWHLGLADLSKGTHKLCFKITGKNDWSLGTFFGVDALDLLPVAH